MSKGMRITLYVVAVYWAVLGILFLFFPRIAETVFKMSLPDAVLTMLYGQVVLGLAYMAYRIAKDESLVKMYAAVVAIFVGHILVFAYQLFTGMVTFAQVGPPLILSVIFPALLYFFKRK